MHVNPLAKPGTSFISLSNILNNLIGSLSCLVKKLAELNYSTFLGP